MTVEEKVKHTIGQLVVDNLSLQTAVAELQAKVKELEAKLPQPDQVSPAG